MSPTPHHQRSSRFLIGGVVILAGVLLLLKQFGIFFPGWLFTWPMLLIVVGLASGYKHQFRDGASFITIFVGLVFLARNNHWIAMDWSYLWPIILIFIGIAIMLKPKNKKYQEHCRRKDWKTHRFDTDYSKDNSDVIESTNIFSGAKKSVISKNFTGGEITCIFGGAEINLSQADFVETAVLDVSVVFGGVKLIVPPHWEVRTDTVTIAGAIEDKRSMLGPQAPDKILILTGAVVFGGVDIKSY